MLVAIDYDGTITSNYNFYVQLTAMLIKSGHQVIVLSGCNPTRVKEIYMDLAHKGITYHKLISRPKQVNSGPQNIGKWKHEMLKYLKVDLWIDNEVKNYKEAGIDFSDLPVNILKV